MFLLLYRVANQVLMRPDEYKAVFRKAVFRWYTIHDCVNFENRVSEKQTSEGS